jgi:hypothetical protein
MRSDAIPNTTSIHVTAAVLGDRLHDRLIEFFNCLPEVVRSEASLVIAAIEQARADWRELRKTGLTTAARGAALMPDYGA